MAETKYVDLIGLAHFYEKFKEYALDNFLLRKTYDLTEADTTDSAITSTGSIFFDSSKGALMLSGEVTITLDKETSCNVILSIKDVTEGTSISAYGETYSPTAGGTVKFHVNDVSSVTININGDSWLSKIAIEESSIKIPDKLSELENDMEFVNAKVTNEKLQLNMFL